MAKKIFAIQSKSILLLYTWSKVSPRAKSYLQSMHYTNVKHVPFQLDEKADWKPSECSGAEVRWKISEAEEASNEEKKVET